MLGWGVAQARLTVAFSGGLDSTVLLHVLAGLRGRLGLELTAVHVHHGLNPAADDWLTWCAGVCRDLQVSFWSEQVEVDRSSSKGLEASARIARYQVFSRCGTRWLALAHHQDDQAETVLHRLLRGAGVAGAAGILPERALESSLPGGTMLIRPLLELGRKELVSYARAHGLRWVEDASNADTGLARNFLRHEVFPLLEARYGAPARTLVRAARHFAEARALLDDLADADLTICAPRGTMLVAKLRALSNARARNVLRRHLHRLGLPAPDESTLAEALRQSLSARDDGTLAVELGGAYLRRYRGELIVVPPVSSSTATLVWRGESSIEWAGGVLAFKAIVGEGIARSKLALAEVRISSRAGGERLRHGPGHSRRSLKNLFQEAGVPPWWRKVLPLLWCGDELVWVAGVGVAAGWACEAGEDGVLPCWRPSTLPGQELGEFHR